MDLIGAGTTALVATFGPILLSKRVQLFTPLTNKVYEIAEKQKTEGYARLILSSLYIVKPIDRVIQALVAPIFLLYTPFTRLKSCWNESGWGSKVCALLVTPVMIGFVMPVALISGLFHSTIFLANGVLQLVAPYSTIYSVIKGKESAREYFDVYTDKQQALKNKRNYERDLLFASIILRSYAFVGTPKKSIQQLVDENPVNQNYQLEVTLHARRTPVAAILGFLDPGYLFPILRTTVYT